MNPSIPVHHLHYLETLPPFKAEVEALRRKHPTPDATEAFYMEFMNLSGRIVAWLKSEYAVDMRSNPRLFRDTGKNMVMPFGVDLSGPMYSGLDAWITAETRTMPCGGSFGSQQVYEASPSGRISRQTRALVLAYTMCQQERIARPKRQLALDKKIEEWKHQLCESITVKHSSYTIDYSLIRKMRSAFVSDRYWYMEIPKTVINDEYFECPVTSYILNYANAKGKQLVKEEIKRRTAMKK